jgi:hypothetical protein
LKSKKIQYVSACHRLFGVLPEINKDGTSSKCLDVQESATKSRSFTPFLAEEFRKLNAVLRFCRPMYILAIWKPGTSSFLVTRPNTGKSLFEMDEDELDFKYRKIEAEKVQAGWTSMYERSLHSW